ncbi:hypothetical protein ISS03_05545 [Patescibacteria group bacterium]|nr:hypothetical protein [Patescibacteria group bacterium]
MESYLNGFFKKADWSSSDRMLWSVFSVAYVVGFVFLVSISLKSILLLVAIVFGFVVFLIVTLKKAIIFVPRHHASVYSVRGEVHRTFQAGWHLVFPYFWFKKSITMPIYYHAMPLFYKDLGSKGLSVGIIDGRCYIRCSLFMKVVDASKALVEVRNDFEVIKSKLEVLVKIYLGGLKVKSLISERPALTRYGLTPRNKKGDTLIFDQILNDFGIQVEKVIFLNIRFCSFTERWYDISGSHRKKMELLSLQNKAAAIRHGGEIILRAFSKKK